jgi:hypothetical protein
MSIGVGGPLRASIVPGATLKPTLQGSFTPQSQFPAPFLPHLIVFMGYFPSDGP